MRNLKILALMAVAGLIRLLEPVVVIRFGSLFASRLGHLAGNTECYLCERDAGMRPKRCIDIWIPQGKPGEQVPAEDVLPRHAHQELGSVGAGGGRVPLVGKAYVYRLAVGPGYSQPHGEVPAAPSVYPE